MAPRKYSVRLGGLGRNGPTQRRLIEDAALHRGQGAGAGEILVCQVRRQHVVIVQVASQRRLAVATVLLELNREAIRDKLA
jgi:hypothetical protein